MARIAKNDEIPEAKIRNAIYYLKKGKTKKFICEYLNIAYNTKRLEKIVTDFKAKEERELELKKKAKNKVFTDKEKAFIAKEYQEGAAQSAIAKSWYVSPQRIKKILIDSGVPIRSRSKKTAAKVDHIVQDLEVKFQKDEKVFIAKYNEFAIIEQVYDEDYLEFLESGKQVYRETHPFKPDKTGLAGGSYFEPAEGIHYEIMWILDDNTEMKLSSVIRLRDQVMKCIEETGREFYRVWQLGDYSRYRYIRRHELFPVRTY